MRHLFHIVTAIVFWLTALLAGGSKNDRFAAISYHNPGLVTDLGTGLWGSPIPCDRNGDGLSDLLLVVSSSPSQGVYYFENTGRRDPHGAEIFRPGVRLSDGAGDVTPSYSGTMVRVLTPGREYPDFLQTGLSGKPRRLDTPSPIHTTSGRIRGNQWSYADYDGDGRSDLIVGIGDWTDYGWDNAFDKNGRWTNGPLHGFVYLLKNRGTSEKPEYDKAVRLEASGQPVDVFGTPSPLLADFRGTGKLDLICGEFLDGMTYFENVGTREKPVYAAGQKLRYQGWPLTMPLQMIVATAFDWNRDGRMDLVVSQEDGRTAWFENTGRVETVTDGHGKETARIPEFNPPQFLRQEAAQIRFGVLTTPVSVDWDGDGQNDLLTGNAAGEIALIKNLGGNPPRWAGPERLEAGDESIRITAGYNGSIQGPAEAKWGYTNIGAGDWDGDGLTDILANSIWGRIVWFRNIGTRTNPKLAPAQPVRVAWNGPPPKPAWNWWNPTADELVVQWRCTPCVMDVDRDGINDLVTVDHEGYLAFFRQVQASGTRILLPGQRIFRMKGFDTYNMKHSVSAASLNGPLRLNNGAAGRSGRRTYCFADWDGDGRTDLLVNSVNVNFLRNVATAPGKWEFVDEGPVDSRKLAGHSTAPAIVDWNGDGVPDLLAGAEDGGLYYLENPRTAASDSEK